MHNYEIIVKIVMKILQNFRHCLLCDDDAGDPRTRVCWSSWQPAGEGPAPGESLCSLGLAEAAASVPGWSQHGSWDQGPGEACPDSPAPAGAPSCSQVSCSQSIIWLEFPVQLFFVPRDAVFEYYSSVLEGVVSRHSTGEGQGASEEEELLIEELQKVLEGFIGSNPEAWAPLVSAWALDTLGRMSSRWSSKISGPPSGLLHDKLSAWLACPAARCLLELAAACLSTLLHTTDTEACVASLLETSVRHAPHFDWVVAHLGSCFPRTVTSRVLSLGLRDFAAASPGSAEAALGKVPKLVTVVSILSHLGSTHPLELEQGVEELAASCLSTTSTSHTNVATVPFLLHLSSQSPGVRRALASSLSTLLAPALPRLATLAPLWLQGSYFSSPEALLSLCAHLLVLSERGGPQLLLLLLEVGAREEGKVGTLSARSLTHLLLSELCTLVHSAPRHRPSEAPLLTALTPHLPALLPLLLSTHPFQLASVSQLLTLLCLHRGRAASASLVAQLLCRSTESRHLATLGHLVVGLELWHPGLVPEGVARALRGEGGGLEGALLDNLARLVELEGGEGARWNSSFRLAVSKQLVSLSGLLLQHTERVLLLLSLVPPGPGLRVAEVHRVCHALVQVG